MRPTQNQLQYPRDLPQPQTTGAPPPSGEVGVGSDGQSLEIPKYIPIFKEPVTNVVVPKATPLADPSTVTIPLRLPQGTFGPFILQGMWAMLAIVPDGGTPADYPLIWADPDAGMLSDSAPTATGPPSFIGPQEGPNFLYTLKIRNVVVQQFHHSHFKDHWRVLSMPVELPDGVSAELEVTRLKCDRFAEDTTVYLFAGLFGRQRQIFPPPFNIDSCNEPVRPIAYTTGKVEIPTSATGTGVLAPPTSVKVPITNRHPTILDELVFSGPQHNYVKVSYQLGSLMTDYVPGRLLNYLHGGRTPAPILIDAPSDVTVELAQPLTVPNQPASFAAIDLAGGAYGW